ncbi:hypothetical protein [Spirosoma fluviale]|uniref:Uncharacterized protein n=1 Tax=Spirosoma fluviale TaxID=1597977 RepID=A0A286FFE1_9BACT|nr:hypothetical protein [Spirosoma fluviale]SOD81928.1 hypothetical protein SAMN06269250_1963 [Spirosoma fluviale]
MATTPTPAEIALMLKIFTDKDGLFRKTDSIDLRPLTNAFDEEVNRLSQFSVDRNKDTSSILTPTRLQQIRSISAEDTFTIKPIPIRGLRSLQAFIDSLDPSLTHLGIYYGFDLSSKKMVLVMQGIRLDGGGDGSRLSERLSENQVSKNQMTTTDLTPQPRDFTLVRQFRGLFIHIYGKGNFVWGAYMKLKALKKALTEFSDEGCDRVKITFGFQKTLAVRISTLDRNCFHLIFTGIRPDGTVSSSTFSTFDGEPGYVAPKPSCPPFGSFLDE